MNFNENLKEAMFCKNMTSKQLSALTEIKVDTINSYLKTNGSLPTVDKAVKIAKVLGVSVEYLVCNSENQKTKPLIYDKEEQILIREYNNLNNFNKQTVQDLLKSLSSRQERM